MSRNQAEDFAQRLYSRVPGHYRVYDAERGQPLLALLRVIGAQAANLRQDLDDLWDNFFIETCDDWVVPYIGALVGANLLQQPVGQSNRLDVWNTVIWRQSKGTPEMLQALAKDISGWPANLAEFFLSLGWSQNLNHVRLDRPLTPDIHDPAQLGLLGHADDPFAHSADFKPARTLDSPSVAVNSIGVGRAGWATSGRYQIHNLGIFVRRLQTFPVRGGTPAAAAPGTTATASCFTFNPLFRDTPLFAEETGVAISRAIFAADPWESFGLDSDIAVRQFGVLLATETAPAVRETAGSAPFNFGGATANISLAEMRLLEPRSFQLGSAHFLITAKWQRGTSSTNLGFLSTLFAASGNSPAFRAGSTGAGTGQLVVTVQTARNGIGWTGPALPASPASRFPGAVLAVRLARSGAVHSSDGLYIYLPPSFISPTDPPATYFAADDGSTYSSSSFTPASLARSSQGQVYPARSSDPSTAPALTFLGLNRMPGAMVLTDPSRFGGGSVLVEAALFTGSPKFQKLGGIATTNQPPTVDPDLQAPNPWPAFTFAPGKGALANGKPPDAARLIILVRALSGNFTPPVELVLVNRSGQSLLVYLPEVQGVPATGIAFLVADDGSTYFFPADPAVQQGLLQQQSLSNLARAGQGQVLSMPGRWPLQQRQPMAINLCRSERSSLLAVGELGIDPELGRFALPPGDPSIAVTSPPQKLAFDRKTLSVDFVEAFTDFVGAVNSTQRQFGPGSTARRFVSRSGDVDRPAADSLPGAPVHTSVADAVLNASNGDVIEIVDSATYEASSAITLPALLKSLTIRAATGQRPCLTFYQPGGQLTSASFAIRSPLTLLVLNGLLISGGPLNVSSNVQSLQITGCTLDPVSSTTASILATDANLNSNASYVLSHCVTGGVWLGRGVGQLTVADSIVDQQGGSAIAGASGPASPPALPPMTPGQSARVVQLERVTVFGSIFCDVLNASESLLNDIAIVNDQQAGCIRFTRFETGSALPRRYRCVPNDAQMQACVPKLRCVAPLFNSRRFTRPDYAQLAARCSEAILTAGEDGGEIGAFAGTQNTIRLRNLKIKLQEFMPVGLSAIVIADS